MKLRKFEFKKVELLGEPQDGAKTVIGTLDYRSIAKEVITQPSPNGNGFSTDDTVKAVMTYGKISDAFNKGDTFALLDNESYQFLSAQLKNFRWGRASIEVVDFINYVRNLPEVEVEPKP